ncbi:hypothetical protein TKK_0016658 [Trichogramma kaykai]
MFDKKEKKRNHSETVAGPMIRNKDEINCQSEFSVTNSNHKSKMDTLSFNEDETNREEIDSVRVDLNNDAPSPAITSLKLTYPRENNQLNTPFEFGASNLKVSGSYDSVNNMPEDELHIETIDDKVLHSPSVMLQESNSYEVSSSEYESSYAEGYYFKNLQLLNENSKLKRIRNPNNCYKPIT